MGVLVSCEDVHVEYPTRKVLAGVSLGLSEGDRVGIVGKNGDGKSTLLSVVSGLLEPDDGRVTMNVFFTYGDGEDELEDVSFTVERGETVGIIGTTGAGKTTLINLLMRFYDARSGEIRINGRDIREYDLTSLRGAIAAVPQKVQLFSGSIEQNLRWGRPDATDEQVVRAARAAQADGFISAKPEGYRALIERGGVNFSGGQRQRLAIARALVRDFDILILDDSSSALDYSTDAAIRSAIRREYAGKTLIVVSQRVNSIMDADKILVLDNGRIVGEGTHESLLRTCDFYREICASQQIKGGAEQ